MTQADTKQQMIDAFAELAGGALEQKFDSGNPALSFSEIRAGDKSLGMFVLNTTSLAVKPGKIGGLKLALRDKKWKVVSRGTELKVTLPVDQASVDSLKTLHKKMAQSHV